MNGPQVGEVNDRIAVGVPAAEVVRLHLGATQMDARPVGVDNPRRRLLPAPDHVRPGILVRDDLRLVDEARVATRVVAVVVGVDDVADRLICHRPDLLADPVDVPRKLVIDQDHSLGGNPHAHVAPDTVDVEQSVFHFRDAERLRLLSGHDQRRDRQSGTHPHQRQPKHRRVCHFTHLTLLSGPLGYHHAKSDYTAASAAGGVTVGCGRGASRYGRRTHRQKPPSRRA